MLPFACPDRTLSEHERGHVLILRSKDHAFHACMKKHDLLTRKTRKVAIFRKKNERIQSVLECEHEMRSNPCIIEVKIPSDHGIILLHPFSRQTFADVMECRVNTIPFVIGNECQCPPDAVQTKRGAAKKHGKRDAGTGEHDDDDTA